MVVVAAPERVGTTVEGAAGRPKGVLQTQVADNDVTTPHGGQDWRQCSNYVEDFSVTTNGLGTPASALAAAREAVSDLSHYPPANFEPHLSHLAGFLWGDAAAAHSDCLQLGNGASELIDLVIRSCSHEGTWRPGPCEVQYEEYKRSAEAAGYTRTSHDDSSASLLCMVNPSNPTGHYFEVDELMNYLESTCKPGTTVIIDESMQPWVGPNWREDSLVSKGVWRRHMSVEKGINVFVMHSWTKIWSCAGIRLGSVIAPTPQLMVQIKAKQVPWSVNNVALTFLTVAIADKEFMRRTWALTPIWRQNMVIKLGEHFPHWRCHGKPFLSWIWIDTADEHEAEAAVLAAKAAGCPIRWGKPGYKKPTVIRLGVRNEQSFEILLEALKKALLPLVLPVSN